MSYSTSKIAVITDTDASLPNSEAERLGIRMVPIHIHFDGTTFDACTEIDDAHLFEKVDREGKFPTTSAPSPGEFSSAFNEAFAAGAESVLCFCVSSEVSAVYNSAMTACSQLPGQDITVIDTRNLSMAQGFIAMAAAQAALEGLSKAECLNRAKSVSQRVNLVAAVYTLKYLAMSGRVGHIAAGFANLLEIKPILTMKDGKLEMLEKIRTRKKAWNRVIELMMRDLGDKPAERMSVVHVNAVEEAVQFAGLLKAAGACNSEVFISSLTPGLSVHTGPGMVGAAYIRA
jgi:DegV family protein with EDD domain